MAPLTGKKVLIIGGSSGVGFGVAKAALAEGAHVIIASSGAAKLDAAVEYFGAGDRVQSHILDVKSEESFEALFAKIGKVDHLVFTAGDASPSGGPPPLFPHIDLPGAKYILDVRFWGVVIAAKYVAKGFVRESITCTSGTANVDPLPHFSVTSGASGALTAMTSGLALDLAPVRANCIALGLVDTGMHLGMSESQWQQLYKHYEDKMPVKHVGTPEEVAEAYLFTMKCSYVTGQTIYVEGGAMFA